MSMDLLSDLLPNSALDTDARAAELRSQMLTLAEEYARLVHAPVPFIPGVSSVPVSGKTVGVSEVQALVSAKQAAIWTWAASASECFLTACNPTESSLWRWCLKPSEMSTGRLPGKRSPLPKAPATKDVTVAHGG